MTSDFKQVLEVRSENLRESKSRREQFSQGALTRSLPQSAMDGFPSGSALARVAMDDDEAAAKANGQVRFQQVFFSENSSFKIRVELYYSMIFERKILTD